jgi:ATP synthase I chain
MDPIDQDLLNDPYYQNIETRLTRISLVIGLGTLMVSSLLSSWNFVISFLVGSLISYLNFSWMKQGVDRLISSFEETQFPVGTPKSSSGCLEKELLSKEAELPDVHSSRSNPGRFESSQTAVPAFHRGSTRSVIFKYFLRYALIGTTLYAIVRFRFFDAKGAIFGLLLFVAAVLFECIHLVIKTLLEERHGRT